MHTTGYTNFSNEEHTGRFELVVRVVVTTQFYDDAADVERQYVEQTLDEWESSHDLELESLYVTDVIERDPVTDNYVRQRGITAIDKLRNLLPRLEADGPSVETSAS